MPWLREAHASRDASAALVLVRPLLGVPRSRLEAYARASGLTWVEDESNADVALDRNYLRAHVMPEIERRFPGYRKALARSAELFREASALLDELSALDAADAICDGALDVATLRRLSEPRARNLLRCFLREGGVEAPPARRLEETIRQLLHARDDRHVRVLLGTAELCCDHGRVRLRPLAPVRAAAVRWRGEEVLAAPGGLGEVVFTCAEGAGISRQRIVGRQVELRSRRGGERIQPDCRRPRRTLKKLLQEHRIEVWERARLPLLYCDEHLVWAPAIGVDCAWQAGPGEPGMLPVWRLEATQGGIARSGPLQSRDY
jgi:tRNA(Ile)-lysidine synthase